MPLVRRRPLLRGAMVAGAGYAAGRSRANTRYREEEQEQRIAELEQQQQYGAPPPSYETAPAPPPSISMEQKAAQLTQLKELLDSGVLTQQEFDVQKQQILAS